MADYYDNNGVLHRSTSPVEIAAVALLAILGFYLLPGFAVTEALQIALTHTATVPLQHPWKFACGISLALHMVFSLLKRGFWKGLGLHLKLSAAFLAVALIAALIFDAHWPQVLFNAAWVDFLPELKQ